jgi:hypothetical protein
MMSFGWRLAECQGDGNIGAQRVMAEPVDNRRTADHQLMHGDSLYASDLGRLVKKMMSFGWRLAECQLAIFIRCHRIAILAKAGWPPL